MTKPATKWAPRTVALASIDLDGSPQMRVHGIDDEHLEQVGAAGELPRVVLVQVGTNPDRYVIIDGWHRVLARKKAGARTIEASYARGDEELAEWLACAANRRNGLSRSPGDKRKAVARALAHPRGAELSDRLIAEHCGVGEHLVADVRRSASPAENAAETDVGECAQVRERAPADDAPTRLGRDGKRYPARATKPAKKPAQDYAGADQMRAQASAVPADRSMPVFDGVPLTVRDGLGAALPAELAGKWARVTKSISAVVDNLEAARRAVTLAKGDITRGSLDLGSESQVLDGLASSIDVALVGATDLLPYAVCSACAGTGKCVACRGRGWLSRRGAERLGRAAE